MRRSTALAATVVVLLTMPAATPDPAPLPAGYWERKYLDGWDDQHGTGYLPLSLSRDSWDHYSLACGVDQNLAMYRATGRNAYLDRALLYVNNVVAGAQVSSSLPGTGFADDRLGWVCAQPGADAGEVPLYESYFWRYATALLRVMGRTPELYHDPAYGRQLDRLLEFAETHVFDKWYRRGAHDTIYRSRTHLAAHWAAIALNLSLVTPDAARRARYREVVDDIDLHLPNYPSSLRSQLRDNPVAPAAYFWNDQWGSAERPGQEVGHGNGVISYLVEAHDFGTQWTRHDMYRLTLLLTAVVWPRGRSYPAYVDGTGTGWFADGFVKLGRYSAAAQRRLEHHEVVNQQFIANMALNARILSGEPFDDR